MRPLRIILKVRYLATLSIIVRSLIDFVDVFDMCSGNTLFAFEHLALRLNVVFLSAFETSHFAFFWGCIYTSVLWYFGVNIVSVWELVWPG